MVDISVLQWASVTILCHVAIHTGRCIKVDRQDIEIQDYKEKRNTFIDIVVLSDKNISVKNIAK